MSRRPPLAPPAALVTALALAALAGLVLVAPEAIAQTKSPFGVGLPEQAAPATHGIFGWIADLQRGFYKELTGAVRAIHEDGFAVVVLAGLAFAYGVFHAAGPGHGKAVISTYVLATGETVRRGILLSFVSAFVQATVAVVLVLVAGLVLKATAVGMTRAAGWLEIGSYMLIVGLGLWLVWTRVIAHLLPAPVRAASLSAAAAPAHGHAHAHHHRHDDGHVHGPGSGHDHHHHDDHHHDHGHSHDTPARAELVTISKLDATRATSDPDRSPHDHGAHGHHHDHAPGEVCGHCGHSHAPDPKLLEGAFEWRKAMAAILAVGFRPCTGAIIVLVFAMSQGLWWAGVAAAYAMAVGTGLTVAILAAAAIGSRDLARFLAGADSPWGLRIHRTVEVLGAFAVLGLGILLLGGALAGGVQLG